MTMRQILKASENESGMAEHLLRSNFINHTCVLLRLVDHFLVYWPREGLVSVVNKRDVTEPREPALYTPCKVKITKKVYSGIIADEGPKSRMLELENKFLEGSYEIPPQCLPSTSTSDEVKEKCDSPMILLCDDAAVTIPSKRKAAEPKQPKKRSKQSSSESTGKILSVSKHNGQRFNVPISPTGDNSEEKLAKDDPQQCFDNNGFDLNAILDWEDENLQYTLPKENQMETILASLTSITTILENMNASNEVLKAELKEVKDVSEDIRSRLEELEETFNQCFPTSHNSKEDMNPTLPEKQPLTTVPGPSVSPNMSNAVPAVISPKSHELSSQEINRKELKTVDEVMAKYSHLKVECKIGVLAVKLAREVYFGDSVLQKCTPRGWQDIPALPHTELTALKMTIFHLFPTLWGSPESFEKKWIVAQEAIAQCCKRLRKKNALNI